MIKLTPPPGTKGSCWRCEHWAGNVIAGCHCTCLRDPGRPLVGGNPMHGCVYWSLSPGLDGMTDQEADVAVRTSKAVRTTE